MSNANINVIRFDKDGNEVVCGQIEEDWVPRTAAGLIALCVQGDAAVGRVLEGHFTLFGAYNTETGEPLGFAQADYDPHEIEVYYGDTQVVPGLSLDDGRAVIAALKDYAHDALF